MPTPDELLRALAETSRPVPLTRIAKRFDERVSVLLRLLSPLTDARLGQVSGPGLVRLDCDPAGRWTARLTEAGRASLQTGSP